MIRKIGSRGDAKSGHIGSYHLEYSEAKYVGNWLLGNAENAEAPFCPNFQPVELFETIC